ncbi:spore photoproduct lyase [Sporobacter termitidis DSM 10068]|uniref:Spore photoproduct lyase n=1 Tax=Sporobacter termitidis DSM 10068 TaxID=1123282 RepID=A0A1M5VR78_9FIRM|nr:spore photoproduct lyase [Sporobacter termitidis]SHH77433.1 spore photoproduct lyase [Sporobacter termitidis DSM 10068]
MFPEAVYYEPDALGYPLGVKLREKYGEKSWIEITSHNSIEELQKKQNSEFARLKQYLIVGTRKTHKYVENHKVSDFLVPYTSSGCSAMCLYCYLVCNYNKCSYLRVFVNREQMMDRLVKTSLAAPAPLTFELGSNSDLVLENTVTENLPWTIEEFARRGRGQITFPTKFDMVDALLPLDHRGKTIFRMSVNPDYIVRRIEIGTSPLKSRIEALNKMNEAGYQTGLLIAPVILLEDWQAMYGALIDTLRAELSDRVKKTSFIEVIFMTYSYVQNAINKEAFPHAPPLFDKERQTGRGKGKYCYREPLRAEGELFLRDRLEKALPEMKLLYIV